MLRVLDGLWGELSCGRSAVLAVVVRAEGSVPRGVGAVMLVREDGSFAGTVGGGIAEAKTIEAAKQIFVTGKAQLLRVVLTPIEGIDGEGICGGAVGIGVYPVHPDSETDITAVQQLLDAVRAHLPGAALGLRMTEGRPSGLLAILPDKASAMHGEQTERLGDLLVVPVSTMPRCVIFGGGHVGRALSIQLTMLDCEVVLMDDRPEIVEADAYPGIRVLLGNYQDIADAVTLCETDCVMVMTSGHRSDLDVLRQVLPVRPRYIGCIGSRKKSAAVLAALRAEGFEEKDCARVHSPIGLAIGAVTPQEIAVSVAAELISVLRLGEGA